MRVLLIGLALTAVSCSQSLQTRSAAPAASSNQLVARLHFAGFEQLNASTNGATLKEIWQLPLTTELKERTAGRLAHALAKAIDPSTNAIAADAPIIADLLKDLAIEEWVLEGRGPDRRRAVWTLAVRLGDQRRKPWESSLAALAKRLADRGRAARLAMSFEIEARWVVVSCGPAGARVRASRSQLFQELKSSGRPSATEGDHFISADADLSKLWSAGEKRPRRALPRVEFKAAAKGDRVRSEATVRFRQGMNWQVAPWQIPTNTITDPENSLISFTSLQGIGPWLHQQPWVRKLPLDSIPNQLFSWGQSFMPFQWQMAAEVPGATNFLARLATERLGSINTNLYQTGVGDLQYSSNPPTVVWHGLPMLRPFLRPAPEPGGDYLLAGIFPIDPGGKAPSPAPGDLLDQVLTRTNLLYYDWEVTQDRMAQLRPVFQLVSLFLEVPRLGPDSVSLKWVEAIEPKLGNTVTEVSIRSQRELAVVRNSHVGLTAIEALSLAYWLESEVFPGMRCPIAFQPAPENLPPAP